MKIEVKALICTELYLLSLHLKLISLKTEHRTQERMTAPFKYSIRLQGSLYGTGR